LNVREWKIVKGKTTAWKFSENELYCTVTSNEPHWILSEKTINSHWIIKAKVYTTDNNNQRSIIFNVKSDLSKGFILTLHHSKLSLSKLSKGKTILIQTWQSEQISKKNSNYFFLKIAKRGMTYTFSIDDKVVNTLTLTDLPDIGSYGFAFEDKGCYTVSDLQLKNIQLAHKYGANPILPSKGFKGSWDENQAFTATIRKFDDTYYLYYTGVDATDPRLEGGGIGRIGVATSKDGYNFEKYQDNPIFDRIDPITGKSLKLQGMSVVQLPDGDYALSYAVWDGERWVALEYAVSSSPLGSFELGLNNPLISTGKDKEFDGMHVHLHNIIKIEDETYVMLYTGNNPKYQGGGDVGGLAISKDYRKWEKFSGNPVFKLGEPGSWDDSHVRPKGFIKYGEYYYMFYEGAHFNETIQRNFWFDQVGMARSRDLIHWERFPNNPIIPADGYDSIVTEWPIPIKMEDGLAIYYWGGSSGDIAISRANIPNRILDRWGK
jgi:predicted GH43/DUF377 family glycosyl hydrolase